MKRILLFILLISSLFTKAQLTNWNHKQAFQIEDHVDRTDFQVLFKINTDSLFNLGQLNANASDLRFATDCDGTTLLDIFVEDTLPSTQANVWVKMDLVANTPKQVFMFYGNSNAGAVSDFATVFPNAFIPTLDVLIDPTVDTLRYDWYEIPAGIKLTLAPTHPGVLIIVARNIIIDGVIDGDSLGYAGGITDDGNGPGKGYGDDLLGAAGYGSGSGAGHGGHGGLGDTTYNDPFDPYGVEYDFNNSISIDAGSGGGAGGYLAPTIIGGAGGAAFGMVAANVSIQGLITANGQKPIGYNFSGAGGGAGGGVLIVADYINVQGDLSVVGGDGGEPDPVINFGYAGGGGGGGRVKFFYGKKLTNLGTADVSGGNSFTLGLQPADGTVFDSLIVSKEPAISLLQIPTQLNLTSVAGSTTICQGDSLEVMTDAGFSNYDYFVNGSLVFSDTINTAKLSGLNDGDTISVASSFSGCIILSNDLLVEVISTQVTNFSFDVNNLSVVFADSTINAVAWYWDFGNGDTSIVENPSYMYIDSTATYSVCLTTLNECGNEDVFCQDVFIQGTVGLGKELIMLDVVVYPNPSSGEFFIKSNETDDMQYNITNMFGQQIINGMIQAGSQVKVSLPQGYFNLSLQSKTGNASKTILILE